MKTARKSNNDILLRNFDVFSQSEKSVSHFKSLIFQLALKGKLDFQKLSNSRIKKPLQTLIEEQKACLKKEGIAFEIESCLLNQSLSVPAKPVIPAQAGIQAKPENSNQMSINNHNVNAAKKPLKAPVEEKKAYLKKEGIAFETESCLLNQSLSVPAKPVIPAQAGIQAKPENSNQMSINNHNVNAAKQHKNFNQANMTTDTSTSIWPMVELGNVCELNPKKSKIKGLPKNLLVSFVPMADLNSHNINFDIKQEKTLESVYSGYTYFAEKDVLLARVTPCFENGKAGIARNLKNRIGFGSSEFFVYRANVNIILPEIIYYFISNNEFIENGKKNMGGTGGLQRLIKDYAIKYKIPLPPLSVQKEIVTLMEKCTLLETQVKEKSQKQNELSKSSMHFITQAQNKKEISHHWRILKNNFKDVLYSENGAKEFKAMAFQLGLDGKLDFKKLSHSKIKKSLQTLIEEQKAYLKKEGIAFEIESCLLNQSLSVPAKPVIPAQAGIQLYKKNLSKRTSVIPVKQVISAKPVIPAQAGIQTNQPTDETLATHSHHINRHSHESGNPDKTRKLKPNEYNNLNAAKKHNNLNQTNTTETSASVWPIVELGGITKVISGQSPKSQFYNEKEQGIPFYQGKKEFGEIYLKEPVKWTTNITKIAMPNDILMSVRAPVGPVNITLQKICIGRGLASIRAMKINQMFLFYFLKKSQYKITGGGGSVFDSINQNAIKQIKIPLPPLEVQKEIVALMEKIENAEKQIHKEKALKLKLSQSLSHLANYQKMCNI